ncbi:DNA-binding protein D-ETS-4-like [Amblyomma americanum]
MLKSLVSPHYPAVEPRHQLVPSPSHSTGVASPASMADTWGMNELGVWFDETENNAPLPCRIKQEPQSAPSSPQSSCMMSQGVAHAHMLDYPALLEELVIVSKNYMTPARSAPAATAAAAPAAAAAPPNATMVAQPGSPSMYDEPCSGLVRCQGAPMYGAAGAAGSVKPCRPPPPSYDQRLAIKTEDCAESDADCCTSLSADKLDQIRLLAMQQAAKDIEIACQILNVSPNPYQWSVANVHSWLVWTQQQYGCPSFRTDYFNMDGAALCSLSEEDFRLRAPGSGDILSAQLEIWKSAAHLRTSEQSHHQQQRSPEQFCPEDSVLDLGSLLGQTISGCGPPDASPPRTSPLSHHSDSHSDATHSDDEGSDASSDTTERCLAAGGGVVAPPGVAGAGRAPSSSHIHLWQFLKELLSQPQMYGSCIRWLDRNRGVFKIEDSVRVARLWGKRKNRPAMNYDKLSRSIRQYYKKGIMKKTERSQRLVYQFCAPYSC